VSVIVITLEFLHKRR